MNKNIYGLTTELNFYASISVYNDVRGNNRNCVYCGLYQIGLKLKSLFLLQDIFITKSQTYSCEKNIQP